MTSKKAVPARSGLSPASPAGRSGSKTSRQGLYLYCVRRKNPASVKAVKTTLDVVKTIDKGEVYAISYSRGLEAVVSGVSLKKFGSEEVQKKAREDLSWIKEKAQIHEHVIEQAMRLGGKTIPVIPMRFGTIFETEESLKKTLKRTYPQFVKTLGKIKGKQEWGVKVYLDEKVFAKHLLEVEQKKREIVSLPKGVDFFAKKKMEGAVKEERERELKSLLGEIFGSLRKLAVRASQGKILDKVITGKKEPMVLNGNFLIREERVVEFQKEINELKTRHQNQGLIIQESGPWPPYNFVEIAATKGS